MHEIGIGPNNRIQHAYNEANFTNGGLYNQTSFSQVSDYRFLGASSFLYLGNAFLIISFLNTIVAVALKQAKVTQRNEAAIPSPVQAEPMVSLVNTKLQIEIVPKAIYTVGSSPCKSPMCLLFDLCIESVLYTFNFCLPVL